MSKLIVLKLMWIVYFSLGSIAGYSQKQDYIWVGGRDYEAANDVKVGVAIDFNTTGAIFESVHIGYNFRSYSASICDDNGDLLFFTNGCAVLNPDASVMENGDSLNYNEWFEKVWLGDCNSGYPGSQSVITLPSFSEPDNYYIIGQIYKYNGQGQNSTIDLNYSTVDTRKRVVLEKNVLLHGDADLISSYLTASYNADRSGFYIIQPKANDSVFVTYFLDEDGFVRMPDQSSSVFMNADYSTGTGTMKFSPDGSQLALYNYYDGLHIYDFDRNTGRFSSHIRISVFDSIDSSQIRFGSVEWSPNSRFIYTASQTELHQIDTWEDDIQNGVRLIDSYNGTLDPFQTTFFLLALAPDCRIYLASTNNSSSYHVIKNPDELGINCNFVQNGIELPYSSGMPSFPNHPRWRVDEESPCDPTITSVFGGEVFNKDEMIVYPVPSQGLLNVNIPQVGVGLMTVKASDGAILRQYPTIGQDEAVIDITDLPPGVYHLQFFPEVNPDGIVYSKRVVKL